MNRRRPVTVLLVGVLTIGASASLAGCAAPFGGNPVTMDRSTVSASTVEEALDFAEVVLPPGASVVGADRQDGVDVLHRLVIDPGSAGVDELLDASAFRVPLQPGTVFIPPVPGFPAPAGPAVRYAQDRRDPSATRNVPIVRDVAVDESDPERVLVHVWAYST